MRGKTLRRSEQEAVENFRLQADGPGTPGESDNGTLSFAASLLHAGSKRAFGEMHNASYHELLFKVPPTSNVCERLFSKAKSVLTPQRSSMLPINFEMIMFLKENGTLWDRRTVAAAETASRIGEGASIAVESAASAMDNA